MTLDPSQMLLSPQVKPLWDTSRTLDDAIAEARGIVAQAKAEHRPTKTFLLYSGGNDSQVLLDAFADQADAIVHIDTGIGIAQVSDFCREVASTYPIPYIELTPPRSFEDCVLNDWGGLPGPGAHRLTYNRLKERPIRQLIRDHRSYNGERFLLLAGVRRAESKRRANREPISRLGGQVWANPLINWTNAEMATYRTLHDTPRSEVAANLHMSGECLCGAMADQRGPRDERAQIEFFYPEFATRLTAIEDECRRRGLTYTEWGVKRDAPAPVHPDQGQFMPLCQSCEFRVEEATDVA